MLWFMEGDTMATVPEPSQTNIDLRWCLCGVPIRIHPLFWAASAVLGLRYYAEQPAGGLGFFALWMAAVLVSVLAHNLGQVLVGRMFGMRGKAVLYGLGGLTPGITVLPCCWQRIAVLLAGPLINVLIVALVWGLTWVPFPAAFREWGWGTAIATGTAIVVRINIFWALLNLIPLWPLTGGQVACAMGEGLFGARGVSVALGLSIVVTALLAIWATLQLSMHLDQRFDERYPLFLEQDGVLLLFCFLLWLRGFRALSSGPHSRPVS
jgi:stage IV sporulation protein FB